MIPKGRPDSQVINDEIIRKTKLTLNCHHIGVIQSFYPSTQTADIEIAYKQVVSIENGVKVFQEYPLLMECPVIVLFGGVDFISLPVTAGDSCLVLFNDRDLDQWLNNGNGGHPTTSRLHDLSDAIAIVGIRPLTNSIARYLSNGIRLSHGNGNSEIDLKENLIESVAQLFLHNGDMTITGDTIINQNLTVDGNTGVGGTLSVTSTSNFGDNISVDGDVSCDSVTFNEGGGFEGNFNVDGDIDATGSITAGGNVGGATLSAANGANGTFSNSVTVVNGIVTSGT